MTQILKHVFLKMNDFQESHLVSAMLHDFLVKHVIFQETHLSVATDILLEKGIFVKII